MEKTKDIFSSIAGLLIIFLIAVGAYKFIQYKRNVKTQVETIERICIITEVEYWQPGRKSVAQLDPEWKVKTSCGYVHTLRYKVEPGDTIKIKIIKFKE